MSFHGTQCGLTAMTKLKPHLYNTIAQYCIFLQQMCVKTSHTLTTLAHSECWCYTNSGFVEIMLETALLITLTKHC